MNSTKQLSLFLGALLMITTSAVSSQSLKSAAKDVNAVMEKLTVTAKVPLKFKSKYHVTGTGDTWGDDGKQGRKTGLSRQGDMSFQAGDSKKQLWVKPKSGSEILVRMFCCANKGRGLFSTTQHSDFIVHLDPPITADQLTPSLIARALGGFFEFEGYSDAESKQAIQNLASELASDPTSTAAEEKTASDVPGVTVVSASVNAAPEAVSRGAGVELLLDYVISAPNSETVEVEENRSLYFNGRLLPGYPNAAIQTRPAGQFSSSLPQRIPDSATPGEYEYRGEVCVAGECISRRSTFRVID